MDRGTVLGLLFTAAAMVVSWFAILLALQDEQHEFVDTVRISIHDVFNADSIHETKQDGRLDEIERAICDIQGDRGHFPCQ